MKPEGKWVKGLAEWTADGVAHLSVAFTWKVAEAYSRAAWYRQAGYRVRAGGPALFHPKVRERLGDVAELGGEMPDAIVHHNPDATVASRGCPVGCWFCIVPKMEGKTFTLLPDFPVRPVLCDNNLSGLPADYQDYIVARYIGAGVQLRDANSGFEPRTFTEDVFVRWRKINRGPWRFAFDDQEERKFVEPVMRMLRDVPARKKRVYVLIGNEPVASCMERIREVIAWGGEPHVQPFIKLTAEERRPHVRFDWSEQLLTDVAGWANGRYWKFTGFEGYRRSHRAPSERYDEQQGLFL